MSRHADLGVTLIDSWRTNSRVTALLVALKRSSGGIEALLELGVVAGGHVPPSKRYMWRNLPLDTPHILTYFSRA